MMKRLFRWCGVLSCLGWLVACTSVPTHATLHVGDEVIAYAQAGSGSPTIVLQAGFGNGKEAWESIFAGAQPAYTVFAYDRPGYGDSPDARGERDACSIALELRQLLQQAQLRPPYILVGHSLGGLYQYVYAKLYPQDVAGILLLDPTHPDHWQHMLSDAPSSAMVLKSARLLVFSSSMRREFDDQAKCLEQIDMRSGLTVPARVLVSSVFSPIEQGAFERMVRRDRSDWLRFTGVTTLEEIPHAGHFIHKDQPQIVIRAIQTMAGTVTRAPNETAHPHPLKND